MVNVFYSMLWDLKWKKSGGSTADFQIGRLLGVQSGKLSAVGEMNYVEIYKW